ncbi:DUF1904 family protein [Peptostreptococcus equinus]|uniref:DUF1904 family protein n=1 Tax=Peptostreptococcus equinus TaxID=3003601 RepID=A0ABY7JQZ8_9FIRM|nr:DUF1904 family protein [Peptostreptococcus sp. CBA3647]WAW15545.1 DUF1904 family protein [Peptostreptococcus sp. CBA3647]
MPQIIFKGVKRDEVKKISKNLPKELGKISDTPVDYFTIERPDTEYFFGGEIFDMYPLIEVIQFDRGQEVESQMASKIQENVKEFGYSECEVYFTHIEKEDYYE